MAATRPPRLEHTALELIENATQLLRNAPGGVLLRYYIGAGPCILGLLYFLTDVTCGAYARSHLVEASLGATALYLWMKCWQAAFCSGLRSAVAEQAPAPWTAGRILRLVYLQCVLQPSGLFLRPIAANLVFPYVWTYDFYQDCAIYGDGTNPSLRAVARRALAQAIRTPWAGFRALSCLHIFAFLVWLNVLVFIFMVPQLVRMFSGVETIFSLSPMALFNTTVIAASLGVTYLCLDPLRKAVCVVRAFHGEARSTGEDLGVELARLRTPARRNLATLALIGWLACSGNLLPVAAAHAAEAAKAVEPAQAGPVDSGQLSQSIEQVLERREYTWRMPLERDVNAPKGQVEGFLDKLFESIKDAWDRFNDWLRKLSRNSSKKHDREGGFGGFSIDPTALLYGCIGLGLVIIGILFWKQVREKRVQLVAAKAIELVPDLRSEDVLADQLPEDGWLKLARQLIDQGELRLALRASYLAGLAHLGHRQLITIARHKSNLDYERELRRRARSRGELLGAFDQNRQVFERAWYGFHEVTGETLSGFNTNLETIRQC